VILTAAQLLIGAIHVFSGLLFLIFENLSSIQPTIAYDIYTFVFGLLVLAFAFTFGRARRQGGLAQLLFPYLSLLLIRWRFWICPASQESQSSRR
jgi:hypothetical protein